MEAMYNSEIAFELNWSLNQRLCPACGAVMREVDRLNEDEAVFVWYECIRSVCKRRQLHKTAGVLFEMA
jgi:hypothetical protein